MGARESNSGQLHCTVTGAGAVGDAVSAARTFAVLQGIGDSDVSRLCVVVEELVANLYEHGGVARGDSVDLSLSRAPGGITIVLADPGQPFDPRTAPPSKPRPDRGGGAGINMVRAWTRLVDYSAQPNGNRLELLMPVQRNPMAPGTPRS
jgi:serine/threonine-protein kinase RsbW